MNDLGLTKTQGTRLVENKGWEQSGIKTRYMKQKKSCSSEEPQDTPLVGVDGFEPPTLCL